MYSALLNLLLVVPLIAAIPVPLHAEFMEEPAAHAESKAKFDEALGIANTQIANMQAALLDPNDNRVVQAFGPNANLNTIKSTVDKLATETMKVQTSDPNFADNETGDTVNAYVPVLQEAPDVEMGNARFGSTFYSGNGDDDKKFRAGTIIHEATHQLAKTGDHVRIDDNKIIRAGLPIPVNARKNGGYAQSPVINNEADMGERYTALKAASPNMEHNADSYRVFASLCSRSLFKRALTQEDPVGYYLAKRQQCSLPPDYPKKKAEAKAAAAAKGAIQKSAQTPTEKGAVKAKTVAKAASNAKGKAPGGGTTKVTKSTTSQKVAKTAPKAVLKSAVKATAKVSTSKKAGKRN